MFNKSILAAALLTVGALTAGSGASAAASAGSSGICATGWPTDQLAGKHVDGFADIWLPGCVWRVPGVPREVTADDTLAAVV